ncbi:MAG: protein translocase subunit SecF [Alphaproteobacteria bacterium]|jgi:preprotein translocase subunit SecF|uniref:protein translocase subunit SecF n=1 Tax=Maricaulis alexandrii TaxID=2570354 RepID=UPI001108B872|nr:protein translocase subunit SecF [Maricaulis alexandrii]MCR9268316.1 protein translocase subunit SecF [Alphaproteobacteria bacterium]
MKLALINLLPTTAKVPFIRVRFVALALSALVLLFSLFEFANVGINFGIDFRGGIQTEVETGSTTTTEELRDLTAALELGEPRVQEAGNTDPERRTFLVALPLQPGEGTVGEEANQTARQTMETALTSVEGLEIRGTTVIGGAVSRELVVTGFVAIGVALFLMLVYIWFRFQWQYSLGAVLALVHDVIATVGMFSVTQMTFDLATVAAILTIVGYSMNDTVVVYDRIRENLRKYKKMPLADVLNLSINDTLSRTILTSATTLVALVSLYLIGGASLQGFAFAMIWGVLIGTYSSIFVAAPLLLFTDVERESTQGGV